MSGPTAYDALLVVIVAERLAELVVAKRNAAWSFARGGVEHGRGHYPAMVVLHTAFLVGCFVEPRLHASPFAEAPAALYAVGLALAVAAQGLRWWVITTLGPRWNTRVIVVPDLPRVEGGPFRWFPHPNYVAVVTEGVVLPLLGGAWVTAFVFTVLNAWLLSVRIRVEEAALRTLARGESG